MKRSTFIKGMLGVCATGGLYAWQIEPFRLEFVKLKLPVENLPKSLNGKTLMQISDIHVGKRFDYKYLVNSFNKAKLHQPDFVVYTGDYITLYKDNILHNELQEVLSNAVKGKLGTLGILGNHDYGKNWAQQSVADDITTMLTDNGITLLRNEQTELEGLNIIGLDDYWGLNFLPYKVMNNYDRSKANIVLCHNPDVCDLDVWNGYQGWILAGHTHGGQCKPPFLDPPVLPVKNKRYSAGKIELANNRTLYINRALGHMIQLRFNVRPEITVFVLESI